MSLEGAREIYAKPFPELMFLAQQAHREHFDPTDVQLSTLLNIKSGACPEDCGYCPQSARFKTGLEVEPLMDVENVVKAAAEAKAAGATRFCMGAAWRSPKPRQMEQVTQMVSAVKELGMETCMTLGMLEEDQAKQLKQAGLDYYNHNIDTSESYYPEIISTRTFADRLDTLDSVRKAGISVCSGGIVGMGETTDDRLAMLVTLANMAPPPDSVPINQLVPVPGTPLENAESVDELDFVRIIATARILMPASVVRLSAGRGSMSEATQALCFLAGANSIFYGDKLLTTENSEEDADRALLHKLGMQAASPVT